MGYFDELMAAGGMPLEEYAEKTAVSPGLTLLTGSPFAANSRFLENLGKHFGVDGRAQKNGLSLGYAGETGVESLVDGYAISDALRQKLTDGGYTFQPVDDGRGSVFLLDRSGAVAGQFQNGDAESGFDKFMFKAVPVGISMLAGAALGGFLPGVPGLGGAGVAGGTSAGAVDAAALGQVGMTGAGVGGAAGAGTGLGAIGADMTAGLGAYANALPAASAMAPTGIAGLGGAASAAGGLGGTLSSLASKAGNFLGTANGIGSLASIASGIYGMGLASDARAASDPFAQYRAGYGQQLAALEANPNLITQRPGFQAGLEAIDRKSAATGYFGSGNMASALSRYSGEFFNNEAQRLAGLAGAGQAPGAGQQLGANLAGQSLGSIGYGLNPLLQALFKGN